MQKSFFKRFWQVLVLATLLVTVMPFNTLAEDDYIAHSVNSDGSINKIYNLKNLMDESRKTVVYLDKDVETTELINIVEGTTSKINLNGHSFIKKEKYDSGPVFWLNPRSTLELYGDTEYREFYKDGKEVISGGLVSGFTAYKGGAVNMQESSTLILKDVALAFNGAEDHGSAIYVKEKNCTIKMYNSKIAYNKTNGSGAIYIDDTGCNVYMENSSIYENNNSGIYINDSNANIKMEENSSISKNGTSGIYANYSWFNISSEDKTAVISDHNNGGVDGGGIHVAARTFGSNCGVISGITFKNNKGSNGGALYLLQNNTQVKNCTFDGNEATYDGGAIYSYGKNTVENCTITNNVCKHEGGGIYGSETYDITLKGLMVVNNNKRKDGANDDVFLRSEPAVKAYILADNIDVNSRIGIRSDIEGDRLLVKNLSSFEEGKTFFLDQTSYHLGFNSSSKELWQRNGSSTYLVKVNGQEFGRFNVGDKVTVTDNNTDDYKAFKNWADHDVLKDYDAEDKKEKTISFTMPAYEVDLTSEYTYYATDLVLDVSCPNVGEDFPLSAVLTYKVNGEEKTYNVTDLNDYFKWFRQVAFTDPKGNAIYINQPFYYKTTKPVEGTAYVCYAAIRKDKEKGLLFSPKMKTTDMQVRFGANNNYKNYITQISVDSYGTLEFISDTFVAGKDTIAKITEKPSFTVYGSKTVEELTLAINRNYLYEVLDDKVSAISITNKTYKLPVLSFKTTEIKDKFKFDSNGKVINGTYTIPLCINPGAENTTGVKLNGNDKVDLTVTVESNTADVIGSIVILTKTGKTKQSVIDEIPTSVNVRAKDGNVYNVEVNLEGIEDKIKEILDGDTVKISEGQRLDLELELKPCGNLDLSNTKFKVTIGEGDVSELFRPTLPGFGGGLFFNLASENGIMLMSEEDTVSENDAVVDDGDDYYFDDNGDLHIVITSVEGTTVSYKIDDGEEQYCDSNSCEVVLNNDKKQYTVTAWANKDGAKSSASTAIYQTFNDVDELETPTFITADGIYTIEDVNNNNVTLEDGKLKLKVEFENDENIKYVVVGDDETYDESKLAPYDKNNGIVLEVKKDEMKFYNVVAYSVDGKGNMSNCRIGSFLLDYSDEIIDDEDTITLDVSIDVPVTGKKLPDRLDILYDGEVIKTITDITYPDDEVVDVADEYTSYVARVNLGSIKDYGIGDDGTIADEYENVEYLVGDVVVNFNEGNKSNGWLDIVDGNLILTILFPMTEPEEISNNLSKIGSLTYNDISYEQALELNEVEYGIDDGFTIVDNYNLPSRVSVTLDDGTSDVVDVIWNNYFTVGFDKSNSNAQQLLIKGKLQLPSYIANPNNLDTNITLTINVKARAIEDIKLVNKQDVLNKLVLSDYEKELLSKDDATMDLSLQTSYIVPDDDIAIIDKHLNNYTKGQVLDISLVKTITTKDSTYIDYVSQTTSDIEVSIKLSGDLINNPQGYNRTYKVLRLHDNTVDVLDASFNESNNTLTFKTDKFSTYAIVYVDTYKDNNNGNNNKVVTCEEYMNSKDWTWSESKKACVYRVSKTSAK